MFSILEMFTIGVGPSSSHTVGPMVAASRFAASLERDGILNRVGRVRTVLYGSLALTGLGHGTDRATVAGLEGNVPKTVDTDHMSNIRMECEAGGELMLNGTHRIDFDYGRDVVMDVWHRMAAHPTACDSKPSTGRTISSTNRSGIPLAVDSSDKATPTT